MLNLPFYICLALLALVLILREWQNARIHRELLNRLLVKHGVDPIPEGHPLAEALKELMPERENWPPEEAGAKKKEARERVTVKFNVPGADILKSMLAKRKVE